MGPLTKNAFKRCRSFFVYILLCSDGSYYTGYTHNLTQRVQLHNQGRGSKYVRGKLPARLIYKKKYRYYKNALKEEWRIKTLTRKQKDNLIMAARRKS